MDQIRDAIGFRAFSAKDPKIEFKRESARVFDEMQDTIRDRVTDVAFLGRLMPQVQRSMPRPQPAQVAAAGAGAAQGAVDGAEAESVQQVRRAPQQPPAAAERALASDSPVDPASIPVVGRNEPCPCGSGLKYRQCHGKKADVQA
jgi:preprotein translocase subunit SecA